MLLVFLVEPYGASSAICKLENTCQNPVIKVESESPICNGFISDGFGINL